MVDPEVGIELHQVVHGEQRFAYERPVVAGDVLTATLTVDALRQIGGNDIIGTPARSPTPTAPWSCTAERHPRPPGGCRA